MRDSSKAKKTIVYQAVNQINGHKYIGATCDYLCRRKSKHIYFALKKNSQTHFHRAIRKYGRDNFVFTVLGVYPDYRSGLDAEIKAIADVNPEYNMTVGGDGTVGHKMDRAIVERLAKEKIGKPGPWKGKKLAASFVGAARRWNESEEGKESWAKCSKLGPKAIQRPVVCLNDGEVYDSISDAGKYYIVSGGMINSVCRKGRHKTAKGMVFRYAEEPNGGLDEALSIAKKAKEDRRRGLMSWRGCD